VVRGERSTFPALPSEISLLIPILALLQAVQVARTPAQAHDARPIRGIAIDERLAQDAKIRVGDRVMAGATPDGVRDTLVVVALLRRDADPAAIARGDYQVRLHLDHLQALVGYGDRVDFFAVATRRDSSADAADSALVAINAAAYGFRAHRTRDIAVETSTTFQVVSRFHRAIGVITIVASAVFLLCIMLLKVDERRREIAALRLMGISVRTVLRAIVLEAAVVSTLGSALGIGIAYAVSAFVNWHYRGVFRTPLAFSIVTFQVVALSVALSLVLGVAAGWLAGWKLVRTPALALFGR
jgi:putative ABC transport system permease protein